MSETHHISGVVGSVVIAESEDGAAGLIQEGLPIGTRDVVVIPKADRAAVALALLGPRDALIERAAEAFYGYFEIPLDWSRLNEKQRDIYREPMRRVLAAIVGGGEGEG